MWMWLAACGGPDGNDGQAAAPDFEAEQRWSADGDDWEPTVAADPASAYVYQATTRIGQRKADIWVRASSDGGATWGPDVLASDGRDAYDPQLAVAGSTGCVVFAFLGGQSGWQTGIRQSCDHGATWSDPVLIAPPGWTTDHGWLTLSPSGDDVYVGFNGSETGELEAGKGYVAVSHDGGATFDDVYVAGDGLTDYWFETGATVAPDGTAYVANVQFSQDYHGPANVVVWRSADGGVTWQSATLFTSQEPARCPWADGCTFGFFGAQAAIAADATGALVAVFSGNDTAGAPNTLWVSSSPGGAQWNAFSVPTALTDGASEANFPLVAAGPSQGDVRIVWQGNQHGDPASWTTWYQQTGDAGRSFLAEPIALSSATDLAPYQSEAGYAFPYGDYAGLSVDGDGRAHVIWGEGASWTGPGGTWWTSER